MTRAALRRLAAYGGRTGVFPVYAAGDLAKVPAGAVLFPRLRGAARSSATGDLVARLRDRPTTEAEIRAWWGAPSPWPLGVALNAGEFQCLDFDDPDAFPEWIAVLAARGTYRLLANTALAATPGGGYHVWAFVPGCREASLKLAAHAAPVFDPRREKSVLCRIETRGRGGYALIPPSPGYVWRTEATVLDLPPTEPEAWQALVDAARSLDRAPAPPVCVLNPTPARTDGVDSPASWFNRNADWRELMERAGGRFYRQVGERLQFTRPGKRTGVSATTGNLDRRGVDRASQKSPNWPGIPVGGYDKFEWLAVLEHGGDRRSAARAVMAMPGYSGAGRPPVERAG